ncbi:hypothetical protein CMV_027169 [Castanea mollissima]|uniref:Uncharacterized protein n=1 Tax=Castanea mollissima TaxID=60419 RepID=A0A8J4QAR9_9ROSI|nr:hypothetical protein CMV_027169 [Castanea mollissima]
MVFYRLTLFEREILEEECHVNSSQDNLPDGDGISSFPPEAPVQISGSRGQTSGKVGTPYDERRTQKVPVVESKKGMREKGVKDREREDWHRLKQSHEENLPKRERDEGRGALRGGRRPEEKALESLKGWIP